MELQLNDLVYILLANLTKTQTQKGRLDINKGVNSTLTKFSVLNS